MLRRARRVLNAFAIGACLGLFGCSSCNKETEEEPVDIPPPVGAATSDELSTNIGQARGLDARIAPTSTKWSQVLPVDDKTAIIAGDTQGQLIALVTRDAGETWLSLKAERKKWSGVGVSPEGVLVLTTGTREKKPVGPAGQLPPIDLVEAFFAGADDDQLGQPGVVFAPPESGAAVAIDAPIAQPAVISDELAAFIVDIQRKRQLLYGVPLGGTQPEPKTLPPGFAAAPFFYGRPAHLVAVRGAQLVLTEVPPSADAEWKTPTIAEGIVAEAGWSKQLAMPPACEYRQWSFQRVTAKGKPAVLGVSPEKQVLVALPDAVLSDSPIGCGNDYIVVETFDAEKERRIPAVCDLSGKCVLSTNPPFREFPDFERSLALAGAEKGAIGVLQVTSPDKWGLYLTQSNDKGEIFDVQRIIGEGEGQRGRIELGALVPMGKRTLLLVSANITGRQARGWFVLASDDGGTTWAPP